MTTPREKRKKLQLWSVSPHAPHSGSLHLIAARMARGLCTGLVAGSFLVCPAIVAADTASAPDAGRLLAEQGAASFPGMQAAAAVRPKRANFERELASQAPRYVADWVLDSGDNRDMPFVIVDKMQAKVFVFNADGRLLGATAALLGWARGDDSVPGIGDRALSSILPEERTTPAGRFVASLGRNLHGKEILWVDYDTAISLHGVVTTQRKERRAQRLDTPTPLDNRISYGCINVPVKFYENVVSPAFTGTNGIVYVLPETRSAREVFGSYDVEDRVRLQAPIPPVQTLIALPAGGNI